jgi:3-phenylpropionate/trans-cinnamate dioxygenase ferredoxin reductase subunit
LVLIGDEPELPYQRPPLSKKYLSGEMAADRLPFRHRSFYDEHRVELKLGQQAVRLDAGRGTVELKDGETLAYDRLLLCLGAESRQLTCPGATLAGVHYLRGLADVAPIQAGVKPQARVVIIGGGYIGLETAATCRKMGCEVTVLEMADRIMNRVVAPPSRNTSRRNIAHMASTSCATCGWSASKARDGSNGGLRRRQQPRGGPGHRRASAPSPPPTREQGRLACDNGIVVDEYCRTSDEAIYAAGDCTNHPSPRFGRRVRLESVDNAFEQAKTAAINLLGRPVAHDRVPWFWSDQFDNKLLIVGLSQDYDRQVLRGDPASRSFSVCYLKGRELLAVEAINHSKDYMAARKLIADRTPLDRTSWPTPNSLKEAI